MAKKPRKKHVQLTLDRARKPTGHGGWRPGAGRKRSGNASHQSREDFPARFPQHVTLRLERGLPSLRDERLVRVLRTQIAFSHSSTYRIVHFAFESNHVHLIVEADGKEALADGVKVTKTRIARRFNRALARRGEVFAERYHTRSLENPTEVRHALCYVLNNERHHAYERGESRPATWFDPFSSAPWFDGWSEPLAIDEPWKAAVVAIPRPVELPRTWLLRVGWRKRGLIRVDEVPGIKKRRRKQKI